VDEGAEEIDERRETHIRTMTHSREHLRSRRQLLRQMAGISMGLPLAPWTDLAALFA
jgi:hypothetical protein